MADQRHIRTQLFPPPMYPVCSCCEIHGSSPEQTMAAIVFAVMEAHREEFVLEQTLVQQEVYATVLALMVERSYLFQRYIPADELKNEVWQYILEHRDEFQGRVGERGPRGFIGQKGELGPIGPQGPAGRPPTEGEIAAAVAAYHHAQGQHLNPEGTQRLMEQAIASYREQHPEEYERMAPRRGFLAHARQWAWLPVAALAGTALAVAIFALFLPKTTSAQDIAAALQNDPAFMAAVTGPADPTGPAGVSPGINDIVSALKEDAGFMSAVKGERGGRGPQGAQGIQGPPGTAPTDVETERIISTYVENHPEIFRQSVFASLSECQSVWIPHVGSTAGYYFACPDGTEFTLPLGGSLTLEEAKTRLAGRYP